MKPSSSRTAIAGLAVRANAAPDPTLPLDACTLGPELATALFAPCDRRDTEDVAAGIARLVASSLVVATPAAPRDRHQRVALRARLGEGRALGVHPVVCARLGGAPLLVCLPRSAAARAGALRLMLRPSALSPLDGTYLAAPKGEAAIGIWYATLDDPETPHAGTFASTAAVEAAFEAGAIGLRASVDVRVAGRRVRTTVGRALLREALPRSAPLDLDRPLHAVALRRMLEALHRSSGARAAREAAEALWRFGLRFATQAGLSIGHDDVRFPPAERETVLADARRERDEAARTYYAGLSTGGDLAWGQRDAFLDALGRMRDALPRWLPATHPLRLVRDARAGLDDAGIVRMAGVERPVDPEPAWIFDHSLADGLPAPGVFAVAVARIARVNGHVRVDRLLQAPLAILRRVRVTRYDCGATEGAPLGEVVNDMRIVRPLAMRVVGRVAMEDVWADGALLVRAGAVIDERAAEALDRALIASVRVRSPLRCLAREGVCAICHGWDRATRRLTEIGAPVGRDAADAILALHRTGVTPSITLAGATYSPRSLKGCDPLPAPGRACFQGIDFVDQPDQGYGAPHRVMTADVGRLVVEDDDGELIAAYRARRGHVILCEDGGRLPRGAQPVRTFRYGEPIVADIPAGTRAVVSWDATRRRQLDEDVRRQVERVEIHAVHLRGELADGTPFERTIPCEGDGFRVMVHEHETVLRGDVVALARRGGWEPCGFVELADLVHPPPPVGGDLWGSPTKRHRERLEQDADGFVEHLGADLEAAILGEAEGGATACFELLARVLMPRHLRAMRRSRAPHHAGSAGGEHDVAQRTNEWGYE